ncbi:hypothetical protein F4775DRAFT_566407 [Biscogniauxia sp. FL1348]|nr:hypothetical protein F4775DRAFT_566407 [Biscogniauxia sp. FL1348]
MSASLRPLLPHPSTTNDSTSTFQRTKRAATIAACEACRKRKSKCSAERPRCATCIERQTHCEYTTLPTETHLKAQKRRLSDLELRSQAFDDFLNVIQSQPEHESIQILKRVRAGANTQEVLKLIHEASLLLQVVQKPEHHSRYEFPYIREMPIYLTRWQNPYLASLLFENVSSTSTKQTASPEVLNDINGETQNMYLVPYHAVELVDPRITQANISNWTRVSSDNPTLRALLGIYFAFLFPSHLHLDKEAFLDDLVAGNKRFCSPLLVNAILAVAWVCTGPITFGRQKPTNIRKHGYRPAKRRAEYWAPASLGYCFLAEARRLYDLERLNPALTTVQATIIIHLEYCINGVDELGRLYLQEAVDMAWHLGIFKPNPTRSREWQLVAETTAWALFNWQAQVAHRSFQPPLLLDPPQYPLPGPGTGERELHTKRAPGQEPIHTSDSILFKALSSFRVIMNHVARETCKSPSNSIEISYNEAFFFRSSLTAWYDDLPDPLKSRNIALPSHLKLHMHYHNLMIYLFEPFEKMDPIDGEDSPGDILGQSKACFETLVRLYYLRHGFECHDASLVHFLALLGFSALRDLATADNSNNNIEELRSTVVLCAKGLWDQGRGSFAARALFRLYLASLGAAEARLVRDAVGGSGPEPEPPDDTTMDAVVREVRSAWPVGLFSATKANRFRSLNDFARWWEEKSGGRGGGGGVAMDGVAAVAAAAGQAPGGESSAFMSVGVL